MIVALVCPTINSSEQQMSLGTGYLASYLLAKNKDLTVRVLDTGVSTPKEIDRFLTTPFDLIGFSITSRAFREAVSLARSARLKQPSVPVIFGGPHVSVVRHQVLAESCVDLGAYGEGEDTLNEVVQLLREQPLGFCPESLSSVAGLIFRHSGQVVVNEPRSLLEDLDSLPFPASDLFPMDRYTGKLPMITSRGCPFSCAFCASARIWGRRWRARSPQNVLEEIQYLVRRYGPVPIDFHDDGFNMSLKRVNELCDLLLEARVKIPWGVRGFRIDIVNEGVARKMREAGCSHVAIGIESANPDMLTRMGKKLNIGQISEGIRVLRMAGIDVIGQFMIGNPGETLATVRESVQFAESSGLTKAVFGTAVPFPETDLWNYVEQEGRFLVDKDCTRFEEAIPRIIFETPEFAAQDRLRAIELVTAAGMMHSEADRKSVRQRTIKAVVYKYMFKILPARLAYRLYFFLRALRRRVNDRSQSWGVLGRPWRFGAAVAQSIRSKGPGASDAL